ncbi:P-loop containing nucleoside triphosphate hydrolase protein [Lipomyces arxii]|uniref:P-loop containing nucleoside triphosphate hydrolase protein n=1 Tax=Lipomyces arxii TaxID=56418 RepID=UPI0034CDB90E
MAKFKFKKQKEDDFIGTISDSDTEIPDLDDDDLDETEPVPEEAVKPKPKPKSINGKFKQEEENDFSLDFDLESFDSAPRFDGWDFDMQDRAKGSGRKQVDLDGIISRQLKKKNTEESDEELEDDSEDLDAVADDGSDLDASESEKSAVATKAKKSAPKAESVFPDSGEDLSENESIKGETSIKGPYRLSSDDEDEADKDESAIKDEEAVTGGKATESANDDDEAENDMDTEGSSDEGEVEEKDDPKAVAKFFAKAPAPSSTSAHMQFHTLSISRPLLRGIANLGFVTPTPIQSAVIPIAMLGKDVVAGAVTGSGKTGAYMIPVLERLLYRPKKIASTRVVVLTPTRELAIQVADVGRKLSQYVAGIRFGLAVGGLNLRVQEQELKTRPDIVVATPGRFIDHIRNSPSFQVEDVEILIIDEADRMLEEGFQKELTEMLTLLPSKRQTLLFSATMNSSIKSLIQLSLHQPIRIMIDPPKQAASGLIQEFIRIRKREAAKPAILTWLLKKFDSGERVMVFVSRKETAHRLRVVMGLLGIKVGELHGALSQDQRLTGITEFRNSSVPVLVCTDLASRGLDIPKVEIVINYDMPKSHDIYLHRVGRTARAGRTGRSISLVGEVKMERTIVKEAVKSVQKEKGKAVSRNVDWEVVNKIAKRIEDLESNVDEVLQEEKEEKQMAIAEMELRKGENMVKHWDEIKSRPKRTWFDNESSKKGGSFAGKKRKTQRSSNE